MDAKKPTIISEGRLVCYLPVVNSTGEKKPPRGGFCIRGCGDFLILDATIPAKKFYFFLSHSVNNFSKVFHAAFLLIGRKRKNLPEQVGRYKNSGRTLSGINIPFFSQSATASFNKIHAVYFCRLIVSVNAKTAGRRV